MSEGKWKDLSPNTGNVNLNMWIRIWQRIEIGRLLRRILLSTGNYENTREIEQYLPSRISSKCPVLHAVKITPMSGRLCFSNNSISIL